MSQYQVSPGFPRGQVLGTTWSHPIEKTDPTVTGQSQVNTKKAFSDVHAKTGAVLSNEIVTCVAVQNTTGAAVLPGTNQTVKGYAGVVDEYLPAAGAPDKEIYWLVIDGPTQQPLGTRVSLIAAGAAEPRMVLDEDGNEVPERSGNPGEDTDGTTDAVPVTDPDTTTNP
jgi:hypothetical protein